MQLALELAQKGCGWTSPNPMVGAVIVKDGRIIGQGWHTRYGKLHAERHALAACTKDPAGATIYVTLEPCCHHGKQPPCTEAILAAGIQRVVVGSADPNPLVAGKGIASVLLETGVPVLFGVLTTENIEQAIERAGTKAGNKGYDCALSAVEMVNLLRAMDAE